LTGEKKVTNKENDNANEILDRIDLVNKSLVAIQQDIAAIVRDTVSEVLKERKKYVEVGYR
jgi:hypothetical protein